MNVRQVQRLSLRCIQQVRYASKPSEEFRFSQSAAYYGRDKIIQKQKVPNLSEPLYIPSPYDTIEFANRRLLYAVLSFFGLLAYFGYFREPNDIDAVLNSPPHIIMSNMKRRMLQAQIAEQKAAGKSTELLEAELEYVDIEEAAMKARANKQKL